MFTSEDDAMEAVAEETSRAEGTQGNESGTYLTFDLSGQLLGVEVQHVREILDQVTIRLLPNAPSDIEGVIDIRGESIPVIDMGARLGLPRNADNEDTRIIVFEVVDSDSVNPIGVLADRVRDVTQISASNVEEPPKITGASWDSSILHGFARQDSSLILLLDVPKVFAGSSGGMIDMSFV